MGSRRQQLAVTIMSIGLIASSCSSAAPSQASGGLPSGAATSAETNSDGTDSGGTTQAVTNVDPTTGAPDVDLTEIPLNPDVVSGVLDNGLTYYTLANSAPGGSVSMRLVVNAGALQESPLGTGRAHYLEHMMFNGTEKYPANELDSALRRIGAEIGPDFNAFTSASETVYQISITDAGDNVETALDILAQWASAANIDLKQVDAEAAVVREEIRIRNEGSQGRVAEAFDKAYYIDTPFEGTSVAGDQSTILSTTAEELRSFYDDYYRPDNMAIVMVGDRSANNMAEMIEDIFGGIENRGNGGEIADTMKFDLRTEPYVDVLVDPTYGDSFVSIDIPLQAWDPNTVGGSRLQAVEVIASLMLDERIRDGVAAGNVELNRGGASWFEYGRGLSYYGFNIDAQDLTAGTETLLALVNTASRDGFTDSELERAIAAYDASLDQYLEGARSIQDSQLADALAFYFLNTSTAEDATDYVARMNRTLDSLTLDEVNGHFAWTINRTAPIVVVVGADEATAGNVEGHFAAIERSLTASAQAATEVEEIETLIAEPSAVEEVERLALDQRAGVELVFDNGSRAFFVESDIEAATVSVFTESATGQLSIRTADQSSLEVATAAVAASGFGEWSPVQVKRYLADKSVSLAPYSDVSVVGFSGNAATEDVEILFQLLHGSIVSPVVDDVALQQTKDAFQSQVERDSFDSVASTDLAFIAKYDGTTSLTVDEVIALDKSAAERIYDSAFGDLASHNFYFIGDMETDEFVELARTYIGSLPDAEPGEFEDPPVVELTTTRIGVGEGSAAGGFRLAHTASLDSSIETRVVGQVAETILNDRLFTVLREELGATYGGWSSVWFSRTSDRADLVVSVDGDPTRVDEIAESVASELSNMAAGNIDPSDFSEAVAVIENEYNFIDNWFITTSLIDESRRPADQVINRTDQFRALQQVTEADVAAFIKSMLATGDGVEIRNIPE